jgi:hypothetical protein
MVRAVVSTRRQSVLGVFILVAACGGSDETHASAAPDSGGLPPPADAAMSVLDAGLGPRMDAGEPASDASAPSDAAIPVSCPVEAPTSCPDAAAIRYADVAPIIEARCAPCHSPLWSGPWPLNTLAHVRDWTDDIRTNLVACTMPPPDAGIPITKAERLTMLQWIRCGLPE